MICRVHDIGWNTHLADKLGRFHSSQEAFAAYRKTIEGTVERGRIRVYVPPASVQAWKEEAGQNAGPSSPAAPVS